MRIEYISGKTSIKLIMKGSSRNENELLQESHGFAFIVSTLNVSENYFVCDVRDGVRFIAK